MKEYNFYFSKTENINFFFFLKKDSFDQDVNELNERFEQVSTWLQQNDTTGEVDIDAVTEPRDPLSKQLNLHKESFHFAKLNIFFSFFKHRLLYLVAEDATIEDTLYILEKALGRGEIDTEVFLKVFFSFYSVNLKSNFSFILDRS